MHPENNSLFPKFAIARAQSPTREARVLPDPIVYLSRTMIGKVFVVCALGCLFGCGSKKGSAEETTAAEANCTIVKTSSNLSLL